MKDLNLLEGVEAAEGQFYERHLRSQALNKLKAARRGLILLLTLRDQIALNEQTGQPFDYVEQAYIELAAAVFVNARAAFILTKTGYLIPARILLRTLWEEVVFMEYFRLYPDESRAWALAANRSAGRTPSPRSAWSAVKAKARDSVLGGKRGPVYDYLTRYAHTHRHALFELTAASSDTKAATSFGPAYAATNVDFTLELMTSLLVSAIEVLERVFESRLRQTGAQPLTEILGSILKLALSDYSLNSSQHTKSVQKADDPEDKPETPAHAD